MGDPSAPAAEPSSRLRFVTCARSVWGAEQSLRLIINALAERGIAAEVVCFAGPVADFFGQHTSAAAVTTLPPVAGRVRVARAFWRTLRTRPALTTVVFSLDLLALAVTPSRRRWAPTLVADIHDSPPKLRTRLVMRCLLRRFDLAIAISRFSRAWTVGAPRDAVVRRPLDADSQPPNPPTGPVTRVGIVGRLDPEKRIELAIDAVAQLPGISLHIYGGGYAAAETYPGRLQHYADQRLPGRYAFIPPTEPAQIYAAIDVLVVCNPGEPNGRTIGEAMAALVPVIVPDQGGAAENVEHGVTGLRFTADDAGSLAGAIELLAADPELRQRLTRQARMTIVKERSPRVIADAYLGAITGVDPAKNQP